ncbi:MAG: AMP-dependent synthetase/ligase [Micrococcus sp.]|nr:AMP-dependent synthetase/ligase [Micrococcus sp.]
MQQINTPPAESLPADWNVTDLLERQVRDRSQGILFSVESSENAWTDISAAEFHARVSEVAKGLIGAGISPGDSVGLMASTRYEWTLVDFAIWYAGAVTVPIYETSSASQVAWILEDADVKAVIAENADKKKTVQDAVHRENLGELTGLWIMDTEDGRPGSGLDELAGRGSEVSDEDLEKARSAATMDDLATIIYTSGTTGKPKGCLLTHGNFAELSHQTLVGGLGEIVHEDSSTVLFIPLAHVFARFISVLTVAAGARTGHVQDLTKLSGALQSFKPSFLLAVPRVFEKVYNASLLKAQEGGKGKIFEAGATTAIEYSKALGSGSVPFMLRAKHALFGKLLYGKIRDAMGGELTYAVSGGGPLSVDLAHFFRGIGLVVLEGYGLTETTAPVTVNRPDALKIGTVGRPLGGNGIKIAEDGEILAQGICVMKGYHNRDDANQEAFQDGWFRTGDMGSLDADGFLKITGRKKEILVTAGGKNVAPAQMEDMIRSDALVSQVMVVGDAKPFVAAIVTLDADTLPGWLSAHGMDSSLSVADAAKDEQVRAHVEKLVKKANDSVSRAESIREFRILDRDFSLEDGHMTPSLKMKRAVIMKDFEAEIEDIYAGS